ncbi:hypothetical protein, partial [Micromonospora sp. 4G55]|uniref:hypothetical protein n=1 Tax=Micromonospora sp. 4G55 TaxID=2806102 RepID=UPI001EE402AF
MSTRSVPGTRTVKPSTPCGPGATPAPKLTHWVRTGCQVSGSGSPAHSMWLSTRSVPGTRTV